MWIKILEIALVCVYLAFNILTAKLMSAKCMKHSFIDGQCMVGKICANICLLKSLELRVVSRSKELPVG